MKIGYYIALLWLLAACNPDGAGCFEPAGDTQMTVLTLPTFEAVDVTSNIAVLLVPGQVQQVSIATGSNLQAGIMAEVRNGTLYLDNLNRCNWTRKYEDPLVTIVTPDLQRLVVRGSGQVSSSDTLTLDRLKLEVTEGVGDVYLTLKVGELEVVSNGLSNIYLSGQTERLQVGFYNNDGIFFGEQLRALSCRVDHRGSNALHIQVADSLYGGIYSLGNVYVHGPRPAAIEVTESSKGRLVFVE